MIRKKSRELQREGFKDNLKANESSKTLKRILKFRDRRSERIPTTRVTPKNRYSESTLIGSEYVE